MLKISVIYHSKAGHTLQMAKAVLKGVESEEGIEAKLISVEEVKNNWDFINESEAIIFGSPTYMGSISSAFKIFMDDTSKIWLKQQWKDKLAAGFTNSGWASGDKLNSLMQLAIFAAQHGMIWISTGLIPGDLCKEEDKKELNLLGSFMGAMAQSPFSESSATAPPQSDLKTAENLGQRVAILTKRWVKGASV